VYIIATFSPEQPADFFTCVKVLGLGTEDAENRMGTADGENSILDTDGHFKAVGLFMTNFKTNSMIKNRAEQQAHK